MTHRKGERPIRRWTTSLWMGILAAAMATTMAADAVHQARGAHAASGAAPSRPVSAVYAYDRGSLSLRDEDADAITQLHLAFAEIRDGRVSDASLHSLSAYKRYVRRHPHILPVLSVGGWGAEGFREAVATVESRALFASSAAELMEEHGFLGLDIDWEYPAAEDRDAFTALLRAVRTELSALTEKDGRARVLSIAVGVSQSCVDALDVPAVAGIVDQVVLMTYDLTDFSRTTGHHTGLYGGESGASADTGVRRWAAAGMPRAKMLLGAAFYGKAWRGVDDPSGDGLGVRAETSGNQVMSFASVRKMAAQDGCRSYFDDQAQAPWLFDGSTFVSYEDERSLSAKAQYVNREGLLGVACFEYGYDQAGALMHALRDALGN